MRQRMLLVATWLVATALATGVGFLAISVVGDVLRGAGPLGTSYQTPSAPPPPAPVEPVRRTVTVEQVELDVECRGRAATLLSWTPFPPWRVTGTETGPDEDVEVVVEDADREVRVEVYCNRGEPQPVVFD